MGVALRALQGTGGASKLGPGVTEEHVRELERLYEQFGRPLEAEHWGEFLAVTVDGRTALAETLRECMRLADSLGEFAFVYKVGDQDVGKIR